MFCLPTNLRVARGNQNTWFQTRIAIFTEIV